MSHSLIEIPASDWPQLRDLYAECQAQSTGYNCIQNFIEWHAQDASLYIKCLSLDGDWQRDGTFLMIANTGSTMPSLFFNTLQDSLERLIVALNCLEAKRYEYLLYGYGLRLMPAVLAFENNLKLENVIHQETIWYQASKELVENFSVDPPAGITLARLSVEDAETINELWPHRHDGSINLVRNLIRLNVSIGAYDEAGKLIAWCLRLPIGSLGLLQVLDTHKRRGLGSLLVRAQSKQIAVLNGEVLAPVVTENTASRQMFEKMGYKPIDKVYWSFS